VATTATAKGGAPARDDFDYVVVGGGSAGCVLANRLSEDRGTRVLLLEAGGSDWSPLFRIPIGTMKIGRQYDWCYESEPDPSRAGRTPQWAAGKVLGGGSSINAMFWSRGNPRDYDNWARDGALGWSYDEVLPYFKKAETFDGGANAYRGGDGPQDVSRLRVTHEMTDVFVAGAQQAGHRELADFNAAEQVGVSLAQYSQRRGLRASTSSAYLKRARWRRNLVVRTGANATRVVLDGTRAVGVEYQRNGKSSTVRARREVILAAGAIASPRLLMLSGIGPSDELAAQGIATRVESPGVGSNLQEHPYAPMMFGVTVPTLNVDTTSVTAMIRHGIDFLVFRRGPVTSGAVHAVVFAKTDPSIDVPQTEILFAPFGVMGATSENDDGHEEVAHDVHDMQLSAVAAVTVYPSVLHPKARGRIRLRSADPADPPVIEHEMLSHDEDVRALIRSCRAAREIFGTEAMKPFVATEMMPGNAVNTDEEFGAFFQMASFGGFHPAGTCRMGSDTGAVVDPELGVRGVDGLRVVDASVIPTLPSGHTNAPVIMIAERAADLIRGRAR
jgi:choline dehydrogenase